MKKRVLVLVLMSLLAFSVSAQDIDFSTYQASFQDFAEAVAASLPFNASIGLGWSPAYIGQFPHFGVGITAGATTIPYDAIKPVLDGFGITLPSEMDFASQYGFPLPAFAVDARLGGFGFPFDLGFKIGMLPDDAQVLLPYPMDYMMVGGDVRLPVLKGKGLAPAMSIGVGYTYLRGGVAIPEAIGGDYTVDISSITTDATDLLRFTGADAAFNWQSHVVEAKAQISKKLLILTPFAGIGVAYGISNAGGGLESEVYYSKNGTDWFLVDQAYIDYVKASAGDAVNLTSTGFLVGSDVEGWAVRAFGGFSLNLPLFKIDFNGGYNFTSGAYGLSTNLRIQL